MAANTGAMHFHCQTTLVDAFGALLPTPLKFKRHRAIVFDEVVDSTGRK